jgi:hypothetical protein
MGEVVKVGNIPDCLFVDSIILACVTAVCIPLSISHSIPFHPDRFHHIHPSFPHTFSLDIYPSFFLLLPPLSSLIPFFLLSFPLITGTDILRFNTCTDPSLVLSIARQSIYRARGPIGYISIGLVDMLPESPLTNPIR